jgi:iron complex outermembrane receptor protein
MKGLRKGWLAVSLLVAQAVGAEEFSQLLQAYRSHADLSKITKKESAGISIVFTREEIERMQAKRLGDLLKCVPVLNYTRSANGLRLFSKPSTGYAPLGIVRLYINDHDMTSTSFGSAQLIWGNMPLEAIDHVEIYQGTSSVEFGNEPGTVIIRLYTKLPEREEGGKLRLLADQKGSVDGSGYYGHTTGEKLSLFLYGSGSRLKRTSYEVNGRRYTDDGNDQMVYANLHYEGWRLEAADYRKDNDNFLGRAPAYTSNDGGLEARHSYLHLTRSVDGWKFQLAYDNLFYDRTYISDTPNIFAGMIGNVSDYHIRFEDEIYTASVEKYLHFDRGTLILGGFYKYKSFDANGRFDETKTAYDNGVNLVSLYLEHHYDLNDKTRLLFSLKGDLYRYNREIDDDEAWIGRLGYIQRFDGWRAKLFLVHTYDDPAFYKQYAPGQVPYLSNPHLKQPQMWLATAEVQIGEENHQFRIKPAAYRMKDKVLYRRMDESGDYVGYYNSGTTDTYYRLTLDYTWRPDIENTFYFAIYGGDTDTHAMLSPRFGAIARAINRLGDFDIYNEFRWWSDYNYGGLHMGPAVDYTAAVKYHITEDFSIGIRGENLFDTGFEQAYGGFPESIPVFDRKIWLNLEYLF